MTPAIGNSAVRFFASTSLKKFFATSGRAGELHERGLLHDLLTVFAAELVKRALSKVSRQHNHAMRKAEEVINTKFPGKHVKFDHKERSLSMDGAVGFQQTPNEFGGTLSGSMAGSCLP